jgi:hypothetical protein
MPDYVVGQRWISDTEPDLGLGSIQQIEHRKVNTLKIGVRYASL